MSTRLSVELAPEQCGLADEQIGVAGGIDEFRVTEPSRPNT